MCGGIANRYEIRNNGSGLSPRVRGNRCRRWRCSFRRRSIPACAGESLPHRHGQACRRVYPRVCGGIHASIRFANACRGLSPRVRGNRPRYFEDIIPERSIPACAGESRTSTPAGYDAGVYPRVCGGIGLPFITMVNCQGLSPRVRGNLAAIQSYLLWLRSIPACAGESRECEASLDVIRVYPRVCGGIPSQRAPDAGLGGLSPRVRGNLTAVGFCLFLLRSIPACAGESRPGVAHRVAQRVYPRVCGGICRGRCRRRPGQGLSPRVRGNQAYAGIAASYDGSIPACAGESTMYGRK